MGTFLLNFQEDIIIGAQQWEGDRSPSRELPEQRGHGPKVRRFRDGASSFRRAPARNIARLAVRRLGPQAASRGSADAQPGASRAASFAPGKRRVPATQRPQTPTADG